MQHALEYEKWYNILVGKAEKKRPIIRPMHGSEDMIKQI
jgi:hypothetical protein